MADAYWGCCQTQPAQEQRALLNLRRQGFEAFYPFYLATTKKLKHTVIRPVFASYVFVRLFEDHAWASINGTYGVARLLTRATKDDRRQPQRVPQDFMDSLTQYMKSTASNSQPGPQFEINTRVRVISGVLQNHEALVRWSDRERAGLLFQILNREVEIEFNVDEIELVSDDNRGIDQRRDQNVGNLRTT